MNATLAAFSGAASSDSAARVHSTLPLLGLARMQGINRGHKRREDFFLLYGPRMLPTYLDINDLAQLLGLSVGAVRRRLRMSPWTLPPKAYGFGSMLRWRQSEVMVWLEETGQ